MFRINTTLILFLLASQCGCSAQQEQHSTSNMDQNNADSRIALGHEKVDEIVTLCGDKNIAVVGNHTSMLFADLVDHPTHLIDTLMSRGVNIMQVFAPEHGFRGDHSNGADIKDGFDDQTGLPILSLHGKHRKPSATSLKDIDLIIFDIQDVGARFYTYLSTLLLVMEAAAENGVAVVVLDRPNPHGHHVEGPMLDPEFKSFVGLAPVPVIHGMTLGELALMSNGEGWLEAGIKANLHVIPCEGYTHSTFYSVPIAPSPNLPSDQSIALYPSLCFFEPTLVSIGRGTTMPFEVIGYPNNPQGEYTFIPVSTPGASPNPKHEDQLCQGSNLNNHTTTWDLSFLEHYINVYRQEQGSLEGFFTSIAFFDKLAGTDHLRLSLEQGKSMQDIEDTWKENLKAFKSARTPYLLYPI